MEITHLPEDNLFKTVVDGYTAYVTYIIRDGKLDIRHTIVPPEIGGRGIAAQLVKATYDYALQHHLQPIATCSYAVVWLQRHPEYHGHPGKDYGGCSSCARESNPNLKFRKLPFYPLNYSANFQVQK